MTITLSRVAGAPLAQTLSIRNHRFTVDGSAAEGGSDAGPSPHDLYDAALGACKALTVLWYARRKGWSVQDVHTTVDRDDTQERQGHYRLNATLRITGDLTDAQIRELEAVAHKCPVHKLMTAVTTEIATTVERGT